MRLIRVSVPLLTHETTSTGDIRLLTPRSENISAGNDRSTGAQKYIWSETLKTRIPEPPPGFDMRATLQKVSEMSVWEFYQASKSGGDLDIKKKYKGHGNYEDFGNFFFGIAAKHWGWNKELALRAAGWYQEFRTKNSKDLWGDFWDIDPKSSYGDDPRDQGLIRSGHGISPMEMKELMLELEIDEALHDLRIDSGTEDRTSPDLSLP